MCPKGDDVRTKRQLRYSMQLDIGNTDAAEALSGVCVCACACARV